MNGRAVGWFVGLVHLALAGLMLVPAVVSAWFGEEAALEGCLWAAFVTAGAGALLVVFCRRPARTADGRIDTFRREVLAVVGLSWFALSILGALPYLFSGAIASPVDAIFESASGFTTTGASILTSASFDNPATLDLHEGLAHGILFWRSFTQWLGGLGVVLVFVLLVPGSGALMYRSESSGGSRQAAQQRVRDSAFGLLRVYFVLTGALAVILWGLKRDLFDAFLRSFAILSTGGFSPDGQRSLLSGSFGMDAVLMLFMVLAGIHFSVHDALLRRGWRAGWGAIRRSTEVKAFVGILLASSLFVGLVLWGWGGSNGAAGSDLPNYAHFLRAMRDGAYAVVSLGSTTGAVTQDFDRWPAVCRVVLLGLCVMGACTGSTGGGVKVVRLVVVAKAALQSIRRFARPRAIQSVRVRGGTVDERAVGAITAYFGLWLIVFVLGTMCLAALLPGAVVEAQGVGGGQELLTAATSVLACLNNIGPGLAAVGPWQDYSFLPVLAKLLLAFLMVLGRLELYVVLVLFTPRLWRS